MTNTTLGRLVQVGDQTVIQNLDGSTMSLSPYSNDPPYVPYTWTYIPAGQAPSVYEFCKISGNIVTYNPTGNQPISFLFIPDVPNTSGCCAISELPL